MPPRTIGCEPRRDDLYRERALGAQRLIGVNRRDLLVAGAVQFPGAGPVVAYLSSVRDPILNYIGEQYPFDEALEEFAARVDQAIRVQGSFRATSRSGVFIWR